MMIKKIAVVATAVLITASPLAFAAETSPAAGMRHLIRKRQDLEALLRQICEAEFMCGDL